MTENAEQWFELSLVKEYIGAILKVIGEGPKSMETVLQGHRIFDVLIHGQRFDCCVVSIRYIRARYDNDEGHDTRKYNWEEEVLLIAELPSGVKIVLEPECRLRINYEEAERRNVERKQIEAKSLKAKSADAN